MAEFKDVMMGWKKVCSASTVPRGNGTRYRDCDICSKTCPHIYGVCQSAPAMYDLNHFAKMESEILQFMENHPDPVYPTWLDWLRDSASKPIPEDIAKKLGVEPIEPREDGK